MKKLRKWMFGILASAAVFAIGCGRDADMVAVAVVTKDNSATAAEESIRIELATEAQEKPVEENVKGPGKTVTDQESTTEEPETTAPEPEVEDITLLFAGDVYLSNHVLNAYDKAGGIHGVLDEEIRAEIDAADIFMVNQEFPFTERGTQAADKQYTFRLPHTRLHLMNEMGIDIVTLANNHILDFGPEGITDSIAALNEAGIKYVGAGENLDEAKKLEIIEVGGRKIGFIGTSRVYMATSW
ncbi:MAG: CapA family protein, partial [Lachnospiraceae bacterium]|nr:CapA family protein [Lachnospiraceae bacterium]